MLVVEIGRLCGKHKEPSFNDSLTHFSFKVTLLPRRQNVRYSFEENLACGVQRSLEHDSILSQTERSPNDRFLDLQAFQPFISRHFIYHTLALCK